VETFNVGLTRITRRKMTNSKLRKRKHKVCLSVSACLSTRSLAAFPSINLSIFLTISPFTSQAYFVLSNKDEEKWFYCVDTGKVERWTPEKKNGEK